MSIADRVREAASLLEGWKGSFYPGCPQAEGAENQIFRFNLWISNNGIFSSPRESMDWILRNNPILFSTMEDLLDDLKTSLTVCRVTSHDGQKSMATDFPAMLEAIEDSIDQLFRFSRAVYRSGVIDRFVKLVNYAEYSPSGVNLSEEFNITVRQMVEPVLKGTTIGHEIEDRLIQTICLRRQNFAYLKARKAQQAPRPEEQARPPYLESVLPSIFSATPFPTQAARAKPSFQSHYLARVEHSVNNPAEILGNDSWIPQPPAVPSGQEEWECPYCLQVCSVEEFKGENWKEHILGDIMPYICVLKSCPTPNTLFKSMKAWIRHMTNDHISSSWTCMDTRHHKKLLFESESEFKEHMLEHHSDQFDEIDLDFLADSCFENKARDILLANCPFCPVHSVANLISGELIDHVAQHLLAFAQISLEGYLENCYEQSGTFDRIERIQIASNQRVSDSFADGLNFRRPPQLEPGLNSNLAYGPSRLPVQTLLLPGRPDEADDDRHDDDHLRHSVSSQSVQQSTDMALNQAPNIRTGFNPSSRGNDYVPSPNEIKAQREREQRNEEISLWSQTVGTAIEEEDYFDLAFHSGDYSVSEPGLMLFGSSDDGIMSEDETDCSTAPDSPPALADEHREDRFSTTGVHYSLELTTSPSKTFYNYPWQDTIRHTLHRKEPMQPESSYAAMATFERRAVEVETESITATIDNNSIINVGLKLERSLNLISSHNANALDPTVEDPNAGETNSSPSASVRPKSDSLRNTTSDNVGVPSQEAQSTADDDPLRDVVMQMLGDSPTRQRLSQVQQELEGLCINLDELLATQKSVDSMQIAPPPRQTSVNKPKKNHRSKSLVLYHCVMCGMRAAAKDIFKRHVETQHYPRYDYHCHLENCTATFEKPLHRRDKLLNHYTHVHHIAAPSKSIIERNRDSHLCPPICELCVRSVEDWADFYDCFVKHCEVKPTPSKTSAHRESDGYRK